MEPELGFGIVYRFGRSSVLLLTARRVPSRHVSYPFLAGGGEAADIIANFDWNATPLGSIDNWPGVGGLDSLENSGGK
jgi:hypothetical protein